MRPDAAYVHYCSNETIGGVEYHSIPGANVPLVADASSHFLSRPLDVSKFGLIYAGAQKNAGPAGLTFVIVRDDLIGKAAKGTPTVMDYKLQADADSMLNTCATYSIYVAGLVFKWLKQQGGLSAIEQLNIAKAKLLYDFLDSSSFFKNPVAKEDRSRASRARIRRRFQGRRAAPRAARRRRARASTQARGAMRARLHPMRLRQARVSQDAISATRARSPTEWRPVQLGVGASCGSRVRPQEHAWTSVSPQMQTPSLQLRMQVVPFPPFLQ